MEIKRSAIINAKPEDAWRVLGTEFDDIAVWFTDVHASTGLTAQVGVPGQSGRVCSTARGQLEEKITAFDEQGRTFSFLITKGLPGFVKKAGNTFRVQDAGGGKSKVSFHVDVELNAVAQIFIGWMFERQLNSTADRILADLKVYLETGKPSADKAKATAKYQRKRAA